MVHTHIDIQVNPKPEMLGSMNDNLTRPNIAMVDESHTKIDYEDKRSIFSTANTEENKFFSITNYQITESASGNNGNLKSLKNSKINTSENEIITKEAALKHKFDYSKPIYVCRVCSILLIYDGNQKFKCSQLTII